MSRKLPGMLAFIGAEAMLFAGLIGAWTIARAASRAGEWTVPADPLLPVEATLVNTAALLLSGVLMFVAGRRHTHGLSAVERPLRLAWLLGAAFVVLQGREWLGLVREGLTTRSIRPGSYFYLIVGAHGVHAVGALSGVGVAWWRLRRGTLSPGFFLGAQALWYFVVALWPIIYVRVYF